MKPKINSFNVYVNLAESTQCCLAWVENEYAKMYVLVSPETVTKLDNKIFEIVYTPKPITA